MHKMVCGYFDVSFPVLAEIGCLLTADSFLNGSLEPNSASETYDGRVFPVILGKSYRE